MSGNTKCPVSFSEVKDYVHWQYMPIISIFVLPIITSLTRNVFMPPT